MARTLDPAELVRLLDALADQQWHSGETLAEQFGLSRAGLAKRLSHLRDWGIEFETQVGRGYRLRSSVERLDESRLKAEAPSQLQIKVVQSVDSSNRALLIADPGQDPQALLAEHQSAGRGRRGRSWQSPFGANLYLSMSWNWALWPAGLPALSLVVGVVCANALKAVGLANVQLKWPNDLWVEQKKLGGILIEQSGEVGGACRVVIGVGINVAMQASQATGIDQAWTSVNQALGQQGKANASRTQLAIHLLSGLHECLHRFAEQGLDAWRDQWQSLDVLQGQAIHALDDPDCTGTGVGIDDDGAYLIRCEDGLRRVHAGDVSLRVR